MGYRIVQVLPMGSMRESRFARASEASRGRWQVAKWPGWSTAETIRGWWQRVPPQLPAMWVAERSQIRGHAGVGLEIDGLCGHDGLLVRMKFRRDEDAALRARWSNDYSEVGARDFG